MAKIIEVPQKILDCLAKDDKWDATVKSFIGNVEMYYVMSPYFFPEYTSHGCVHVNAVLENCARLAHKRENEPLLRPKDAAFLVMAVLLHDLGMFLAPAGLRELLYGEAKGIKTEGLDALGMADAFEAYFRKTRRLAPQLLQASFGVTGALARPQEDFDTLTITDKLVYGDFLRVHHPRVAHHIACEGFFGAQRLDVFRDTKVSQKERNLIGLIARSHGMDLRDTAAYIKAQFGNVPKPCKVQVFHLMCLLRLADYLDASADRAPALMHCMQEFKSAYSLGEFAWNQCIEADGYDWGEAKHETLFVEADPQNSKEFSRVESWLLDVQRELDTCWAVLGEHYPRSLTALLTVRRVDSNLLTPECRAEYAKRFVVKPARLRTNPAILGTLAKKLYKEPYSYGTRELVQNAVDACREREELEKRRGNVNYKGHVSVDVDTEKGVYTIRDNGIGMSEDVVLNYFLVAGASYRDSDAWQDTFNPAGPEGGAPSVLRNGRFGVGALATFLLGDTVTVTTRHIDDERGLRFAFSLTNGAQLIDIERCKCEAGTEIEVRLEQAAKEYFAGSMPKLSNGRYDWLTWYVYDKPEVEYQLNGHTFGLSRALTWHGDDAFQLKAKGYAKYLWLYHWKQWQIICNGIMVKADETQYENWGVKYGLPASLPSLLVEDGQEQVQLDITRDNLLAVPAEKELAEQVFCYALARLLTHGVNKYGAFDAAALNNYSKIIRCDERSREDYGIFHPAFLDVASCERLLVVVWNAGGEFGDKLQIPIGEPTVIFSIEGDPWDEDEEEDIFELEYRVDLSDLKLGKAIIYSGCMEDDRYEDYTIMSAEQVDIAEAEKETIRQRLMPIFEQENVIAVYQIDMKHNTQLFDFEGDKGLFREILQKYLGDNPWIPQDMQEREEKFPKAFEKLSHYMV